MAYLGNIFTFSVYIGYLPLQWRQLTVKKETITLECLSIGTPKNNKFSICSKWKIHYFQVSQNLGRVQPHYNVLEYLAPKKHSFSIWDKWKINDFRCPNS